MIQPVTRELVERFYRARLSRDPAKILPYLADDVDWMISGPAELLHFCGQKHGKAEALDVMVRLMPSLLQVRKMVLETTLIDGDRAATFNRLSAIQLSTGRTISYQQAQFMRFREGKLFWYRGLIDSFDAAEQMIGRPIQLTQTDSLPPARAGRIAI